MAQERHGDDFYPAYMTDEPIHQLEQGLEIVLVAGVKTAVALYDTYEKSKPLLNDAKETAASIGTLGLVTALGATIAVQEYGAPAAKKVLHGLAETGIVATALAVHGALGVYDLASPSVKKGAQRLSSLAQRISDKVASEQYVQF